MVNGNHLMVQGQHLMVQCQHLKVQGWYLMIRESGWILECAKIINICHTEERLILVT